MMMSCRIAKHGAVSRINSAQASRNVHGGGRAPWILQAKGNKGRWQNNLDRAEPPPDVLM
jgi:hypothetical protein